MAKKFKIKKGDKVIVTTGREKGKTGEVVRVLREEDRVLVQGVNMKFKHMRRSQEMPEGGRTQREYPLDISNVAYFDAESGKELRRTYTIAALRTALGLGEA